MPRRCRYLIATAVDEIQDALKQQVEAAAPGSELFFVPSVGRIDTMIGLSQPRLVAIDLDLPEVAEHLDRIIEGAGKKDCKVFFFSTDFKEEQASLATTHAIKFNKTLDGDTLIRAVFESSEGEAEDVPDARPCACVEDSEGILPSPGISCTGTRLPSIDELLIKMLDLGGSDLHLSAGSSPRVRTLGELKIIPGFPVIQKGDTDLIINQILDERHMMAFKENGELDFSYSIPGKSRFRVNVFRQRNSTGAVFRTIPFKIPTFEDLGLPQICQDLCDRTRGLILVTGPTGSGKSTTLAAMINYINETKAVHVMTLEDPIEFVYPNKKALVNQREIGEDTSSFGTALKRVLRQDPDVILVGELRDLETISAAITAAETGHLVLGTLHTMGGPETIDRIIDVFPADQQNQVRMQLSGSLVAVFTQILCATVDEKGRIMAQEIMVGVPAIRNLIREGKTHQMTSVIESGSADGMVTLDQSLRKLAVAKKISAETAIEKAQDAKTMYEHLSVTY